MMDIQKLADKYGIARSYIDVTNHSVELSPLSRKTALELLGFPVDDEEKLKAFILSIERQPFLEMVDRVAVIRDDDIPYIYIRSRADVSSEALFSFKLELEEGGVISSAFPLEEIEIADYTSIDGNEYDIRRFFLPKDLAYGYHKFSCTINDVGTVRSSYVMSLIRTPDKTYQIDAIKAGQKVWGVSSQLYSVRSKDNWGIGDFNDLKKMLRYVSKNGGHFVGLNPMHAGFPANKDPFAVSPYSPSSRNWLNIIYISVESVPEYVQCKEALSQVKSDTFQRKLKKLRELEYVDYAGVTSLKLKVLHTIFDHVKVDDKRSIRGRKFLDFVEQGGESLENMATFDALEAYFCAQGINVYSWENFPKEYQNAQSPFVEAWRNEHKRDVLFYCYLQFLAHEQLEEAFLSAKSHGMLIGPYRDLAVGVPKQSCDIWSDSCGIFRTKASLGAPPDPLGPLGQSWGLAPMSPIALKNCAYKPMIDLYRSNMKSCGAIRIDHAAGLFRTWWNKNGENAMTGAYVMSALHDLIGIIALESKRSKCLVIAEDLGTIPNELRVALKKAGAYSYKIFFGERAGDGGFIAPQDYEPQAMAVLTTHDMPTLKGWWEGYDLELGEKLGVYTKQEHENLALDRANAKQRILDSMHGLNSIGDDVPREASQVRMDENLAKAMQVHMCKSSCALYSSQIEDWIGVLKPVNIPGTFMEYPNWRRKLTADIEDIFSRQYVRCMTKSMTEARGKQE